MLNCFTHTQNAIPLYLVTESTWPEVLAQQDTIQQNWLNLQNFTAKAQQYCMVPNGMGTLAAVYIGFNPKQSVKAISHLALQLPLGDYRLIPIEPLDADSQYLLALGWGLGSYIFNRYKANERVSARLVLDSAIDATKLQQALQAIFLARDLINTPAQDMMPEHLAMIAESLAQDFNGHCQQIIGEDLLKENYPLIHAVGRASCHPPRLIDLCFGQSHWPKLTLIGKGVCFDSGGLDIKNASGMQWMKKDMGGAAHVLALTQWLLQQGWPLQLRVLIPAVENAIGSKAYRPGDIIQSRQGLSVEIGNTDAEGRLILADALSEAAREQPACIIDFATLTGAARVAVGTDIAAFFCNDETIAAKLSYHATLQQDPCWRLPLFESYQNMLKSQLADINNSGNSAYAGAITAALFLQAFVPDTIPWLHFDIMAYNLKSTPGKPEGGEAMALRAVLDFIKEYFQF